MAAAATAPGIDLPPIRLLTLPFASVRARYVRRPNWPVSECVHRCGDGAGVARVGRNGAGIVDFRIRVDRGRGPAPLGVSVREEEVVATGMPDRVAPPVDRAAERRE